MLQPAISRTARRQQISDDSGLGTAAGLEPTKEGHPPLRSVKAGQPRVQKRVVSDISRDNTQGKDSCARRKVFVSTA